MDQTAGILKENERLRIRLQQLEDIVLAFRSGNVDASVDQPTDSYVSPLRVSEIRYRRLFEAAHDGILIVDPDTRGIIDANPFMINLLGYPLADLVGMEIFEIGLFSDAQANKDMFEILKATGKIRYENLPLQTEDGALRNVEVVANRYAENGHSVIQFNIRDTTERARAEMERARAEERLQVAHDTFRNLIDRSPFGTYIIDADFHLIQISDGGQKAFANVHPLIGRDFAEVVHFVWPEPFASEVIASFRHTLATGEPCKALINEPRSDIDATEAYDWNIYRITLPDGRPGVVCHFYDFTEKQQQADHIKLLMGEVNHRSKNMLSLIEAIAQQTVKT